MYPITLNATLNNFSSFASRKKNKAFHMLAKRVWQRDRFTCQYCGFQARDYQEVVNVDHNYRNVKLSNLATACCFCAQCFFLESVGLEGGYGGGALIYLPEISQMSLNSLCHVLFCAMLNETNYKETAQSIYRSLRIRTQVIEQQFGEGLQNPAMFGQMLIDYKTAGKPIPEGLMKNIRLLPARSKFKKQITHWAKIAMKELASDKE